MPGSIFNDIADFTTDELRKEIHRRETAAREGRCWYCNRNISAHTCKYASESVAPGWEVSPPRWVSWDGGCMGELEEYWVVNAKHTVMGTCRGGQGDTPEEATQKCLENIQQEESIWKRGCPEIPQ